MNRCRLPNGWRRAVTRLGALLDSAFHAAVNLLKRSTFRTSHDGEPCVYLDVRQPIKQRTLRLLLLLFHLAGFRILLRRRANLRTAAMARNLDQHPGVATDQVIKFLLGQDADQLDAVPAG